jgi:hypothetical protein
VLRTALADRRSGVLKLSVNRSQTGARTRHAISGRSCLTLNRAMLNATRNSQNNAPCSCATCSAFSNSLRLPGSTDLPATGAATRPSSCGGARPRTSVLHHDLSTLVLARTLRVIGAAMAEAGVVGIGRLTLSRRERMVMVEPRGAGMVLFTLRAADEVRAPQFGSALDAEMVAIAGAIIRQRTGTFDPSTYRDRYQEALRELIEAKMKGVAIKPRAVSAPSPVIDLILLSHKIRHHVFVYLSGRKMWYLDLSFSGSGDRSGRQVE